MKQKYLLLTIILFMCLFLFSTPSLALIPGDFGSAGGGPPDGCVDFEDLMIFAMAYGSTPPDANWNLLCDIYPDEVIDFEDLMIFAMHYGERDPVTDITVVTGISNAEKRNFQYTINKGLENKEGFSGDYRSIEYKTKAGTHYNIYVHWSTYSEANTYKVYRKVNEGDFIEVFDGYPPPSSNWPGWDGHGWNDFDVQDGNTYSYYVIAYGSGWQTEPSEIATRRTWLPPCSLNSPSDGAIITTLEPTFSWNPVGLDTSDFPYGDIYYGITHLWMFDGSTDEEVWWSLFDDMTTSTATYNYDGNATPLVPGHNYRWCTLGHGYDENGNFIAGSCSEWNEFIYIGDEEAVISEVNAYTVTYHSDRAKSFIEAAKLESGSRPGSTYYFNEPQVTKEGDVEYGMHVDWSAYLAASGCGYKIYKSVDGLPFTVVFSQEAPSGYDWYDWGDDEAAPGSTYSYYVTAYGGFGETLPSENVTRETWLPPSSAISPVHNSVITDPNPVFTWNSTGVSTPYEDIDFGETILRVWDETNGGDDGPIWTFFLDGLTVSTVTYNQDGEAPPLIPGHVYSWNTGAHGCSDEDLMAISWTENWQFYYGYQTWEVNIATGTHTDLPDGHNVEVRWNDYTGANNYKVWKSLDNISFTELVDNYEEREGWYWVNDWDVAEGNVYYYYVVALDGGTVIQTSPTMTVDTWLPAILPVSPLQGDLVTDPNPVFECYYEAPISFPYNGVFEFSEGYFDLNNVTTGENVWGIELDESVFSVTYDGPALVEGHEYQWGRGLCGQNENVGIFSVCNGGGFYYGYQPWEVTYRTETFSPDEQAVRILWTDYTNANDYQVYKGTDGTNFTSLEGEYEFQGDWYEFWDYEVIDGNTYYYYVKAFDGATELQTSSTMTVDTWLPGIIVIDPIEDEVVTNSTPTFIWQYEDSISFPDGPFDFSGAGMYLYDTVLEDEVWEIELNNLDVFSYTYDGPSLVEGHGYIWCRFIEGEGDDGISTATAGRGSFFFGNLVPNVRYCAITCGSCGLGNYQIEIGWGHYPEATNYHIYKSINSGGYTEIFGFYEENEDGHWFIDNDVTDVNTYKYYVTADTPTGETAPSYTDTIDTWLPLCSLSSPTDEAIVTTSEPTFSWNTIGLETSDFPYGSIFYTGSHLRVRDESSGNERVWDINFDDPAISTVTYNQDGQATPLVIGHRYNWSYWCSGHGEDGEYIAESFNENWQFIYTGGAPAVISEVNAFTEVGNNSAQGSGAIEYLIEANIIPFFYQLNEDEISRSKGVNRGIEVRWTAYLQEGNCGYKVYKSTNGAAFIEAFFQLAPSGYDWYGWWDENVQEGNTYSYYVTAYGDTWETEPSETVTRDTWLPISYLESPIDGATINDPEPTFTWLPVGIADYPYEGTIYSGHTILRVYEDPVFNGDIWSAHSEDLTTSTFIYNQDGQAPSLISGEYYEWNVIAHGVDQEGELAAVSLAGNWGFTYISN